MWLVACNDVVKLVTNVGVCNSNYVEVQVQDIIFDCKRKGGSMRKTLSHHEWSKTVQSEPDVVSMTFIPIASLLSGIHGSGFLGHAINLYLRCKHTFSAETTYIPENDGLISCLVTLIHVKYLF